MDLDSEIAELFRKQNSLGTESDYRRKVNGAAAELFKQQPAGIDLPMRAFVAMVVSMLADYQLSLEEVQKRISRKLV